MVSTVRVKLNNNEGTLNVHQKEDRYMKTCTYRYNLFNSWKRVWEVDTRCLGENLPDIRVSEKGESQNVLYHIPHS